jgi:segregation and condensation protein A
MSQSLARDAVAFLIDLAEKGEVDPWDVKVIDVIDRFLAQLNPFVSTERTQYEINLSQSGQAFLYASMLILLKADSLSDRDRLDAVDEDFLDEEFDPLSPATLPRNLENQIRDAARTD